MSTNDKPAATIETSAIDAEDMLWHYAARMKLPLAFYPKLCADPWCRRRPSAHRNGEGAAH